MSNDIKNPFALLEENALPFDHWYKEEEPTVIGCLMEFSSFTHDRFDLQDTMILETKTGRLVSVILNPYLKNGLERQSAEIGDFVRVDFLGKETSHRGSTFNKFELKVLKSSSL